MDFLSISCIDLLARAFVIAMAESRAFSSDNLIGFTVASCFFLCRRIFSVLLTRSFRSAFFVLSLFLVEGKTNSTLQSLEFGFILLLLLLQKKRESKYKTLYVVRQNFVSVATHNFFGRFSNFLVSTYIILLHFVAFFHVASLLSTGVDNEKVGLDNEKALELDNRIFFSYFNLISI